MRRNRVTWVVALGALAGVLASGVAVAGKPSGGGGGGGGGGDATGGGTVYFTYNGPQYSMNSDGTGKTQLPLAVYDHVPSRDLHGGHRWFLGTQDIAGSTYPNGATRREVFAVRGDGAVSIQLTNDATLAPRLPAWMPGDTSVSWIAEEWSGSSVASAGVYTATMVYDTSGGVTGLAVVPTTATISVGLITQSNGDVRGDIGRYDWSPDGASVVYQRLAVADLWIATTPGTSRRLTAGIDPDWSPDGSKIAFASDGISTISPSGSGLKLVIRTPGSANWLEFPHWSPTGSHLAYRLWESGYNARIDVYRATADGKSTTNLTKDLDTTGWKIAHPVAWR